MYKILLVETLVELTACLAGQPELSPALQLCGHGTDQNMVPSTNSGGIWQMWRCHAGTWFNGGLGWLDSTIQEVFSNLNAYNSIIPSARPLPMQIVHETDTQTATQTSSDNCAHHSMKHNFPKPTLISLWFTAPSRYPHPLTSTLPAKNCIQTRNTTFTEVYNIAG